MLLNNDVHYHVPAVLAAKASGIPCVCRKAGGIGEGRRIKRFLTPLVDLFISISKATERDQIENNPGTRKVTTVFGGVDLGRFTGRVRAGLRAELGVPPGAKVVASIARVLPGRGQQELLRAAAQVLRSYDNVAFLFVGDESPNAGAYMSFLRAEAERMGIAGQAIFPGWRTDVPEILALVDILVQCPSTVTEGLGVVVLEAMAAGKPVVASDNGGLPDAVFHGRTGFVVPRGDSDALAQALLKLLQDEALARRMGIAGRQRAETEFNISHNVRKFEKLLEDCVITAAAGRSR
jgi:glycosyltransferase involved in cell wall biosynthesis